MKGGAEGWEAGTDRHHIQGFITIKIHLIITKILASFLRQGTHCQPLIVFLPNKPRFFSFSFCSSFSMQRICRRKLSGGDLQRTVGFGRGGDCEDRQPGVGQDRGGGIGENLFSCDIGVKLFPHIVNIGGLVNQ